MGVEGHLHAMPLDPSVLILTPASVISLMSKPLSRLDSCMPIVGPLDDWKTQRLVCTQFESSAMNVTSTATSWQPELVGGAPGPGGLVGNPDPVRRLTGMRRPARVSWVSLLILSRELREPCPSGV